MSIATLVSGHARSQDEECVSPASATTSAEPNPTNASQTTTNIRPLPTAAAATTTTTSTSTITTNKDDLEKRPIEELVRLVKSEQFEPAQLSNEEIIHLMLSRQVSVYRLESILGRANAKRCVEIRRQYYVREMELLDKLDLTQHQQHQSATNSEHEHHGTTCTGARLRSTSTSFTTTKSTQTSQNHDHHHQTDQHRHHQNLQLASRIDILRKPHEEEFDYSRVVGACCENVIGCVRLPVGLVGPLLLDDQSVFVPMATTEGCLVASTSRGLSALTRSGGVMSRVRKDCMTRAPIVRFVDPELKDALRNVDRAIEWLQDPHNKEKIQSAFRSTSRHTTLVDYTLHPIGRELHIRFEAQTGDAMGMNMCSKGAEMAIREMQRNFPTMDILTVSGNMCTDKKPSAINMILGRGKSVECNATLTEEVVERVLKVSVDKLYEVWLKKNMVGSAMAGSIGGFNSHAANIVAAIFIATGQDAAQVVSSSNCILTLEKDPRGSLEVHCKMPSIECGTVGGGTVLSDQSNYLQLMGIYGPTRSQPTTTTTTTTATRPPQNTTTSSAEVANSDSNACKLAKIVCSTVMAAELSLLASLTEGTLVKSHMTHNRSCNVV